MNDHSTTTPDTPHHNPFAERVNRTFLEPVRTMLEQSGLSGRYWEYALEYAVYIANRTPHSALNMSPIEKLTGKKPNLRYARPFGCAAFGYESKPKSKVRSRAVPGLMMGCTDHGIYTVELLSNGKIVKSVHVKFDEASFPALDRDDSSSSNDGEDSEFGGGTASIESDESSCSSVDSAPELGRVDGYSSEEECLAETEEPECEAEPEEDAEEHEDEFYVTEEEPTQPRRSKRTVAQPERLGYNGVVHHAAPAISFPITTGDEPSVKEAMNATYPEVLLWKQAITDELDTLERKGTWSVAGSLSHPKMYVRSNGKHDEVVLPSHVVLKVKRDADGNPSRFKARVVAGGNLQIPGKDFNAVYAPVVDFTAVLSALNLSL